MLAYLLHQIALTAYGLIVGATGAVVYQLAREVDLW
jgi:hypothetical protein